MTSLTSFELLRKVRFPPIYVTASLVVSLGGLLNGYMDSSLTIPYESILTLTPGWILVPLAL